ncbi:MAG: hypothetical protein J1E43_07970 [Christensenellaceae bacterium]|nr:hypothetical protein [Christensenellaceae bacterium]
MSMKRILQGLLGYVLALMLTVSLTGACVTALTLRLLTDEGLHERVATDKRVTASQLDRVEATVHELAETYHFAPETVLDLLTHEQLEAYGREVAAWRMSLLSASPLSEAPFPDTYDIEEAVREDEQFRDATDELMRRTVARDDVAYPISKVLQEAAMPVRVSLISLAIPMISDRVSIPALIGRLGMLRTVLCSASVFLLALLLLSQGKKRLLFGSASLLATFVLLAVMTAGTLIANLPGAVASLSPLLSLQLSVLQGALMPSVLLTEAALLLVGALMLLLCLKQPRKPYQGRHERNRS